MGCIIARRFVNLKVIINILRSSIKDLLRLIMLFHSLDFSMELRIDHPHLYSMLLVISMPFTKNSKIKINYNPL